MTGGKQTFGSKEVDIINVAVEKKIKIVADIQAELIEHFRYMLDIIEEEVQEGDDVELAFVWYGIDLYQGAIMITGAMSPALGQLVTVEGEVLEVTEDLIPSLMQRLFFTVRTDKLAECRDAYAVQALVRSALKLSRGRVWNSETGAIEDEVESESSSKLFEKYDTLEKVISEIASVAAASEFDLDNLTQEQRESLRQYENTASAQKKNRLC
jgi:hypothetical protein